MDLFPISGVLRGFEASTNVGAASSRDRTFAETAIAAKAGSLGIATEHLPVGSKYFKAFYGF